MLPDLRFMLATVLVAFAVVIFGLGAAALLRAAHEDFASLPARHLPPVSESPPMLALLRVNPPVRSEAAELEASVAVKPQTEPKFEIEEKGASLPAAAASGAAESGADAALPVTAALTPPGTSSPDAGTSSEPEKTAAKPRVRNLRTVRAARARARQILAARRAQANARQQAVTNNPFANLFGAP